MTAPPAPRGTDGGTGAIDSGPGCNNRCQVCPRPSPGPDAAGEAFLPLPRVLAGAGPLRLHGGEPTLHPDCEDFLARAHAAGRPVSVETNARTLATPGRAAQLRAAGLSHAVVTLHGAREPSHDFLTRAPGSFRQTIAGASQLRAAGVPLTVRLLVTRSTVLELGAMATLALGMGAAAVRFSWARMEPRAVPVPLVRASLPDDPKGPLRFDTNTPAGDRAGYDETREWLVARYPLAADALAAAVGAVARVRRPVTLDGVPACLAPPPGVTVAAESCFAPGPAADRYAAPCEACSLRGACPGVPAGYLARFGDGELRPRAAATPA